MNNIDKVLRITGALNENISNNAPVPLRPREMIFLKPRAFASPCETLLRTNSRPSRFRS
jgi:hypothetical protein